MLPAGLGPRAFTHGLPGGPDAIGYMLSGFDGDRPVRELWRLHAM